MFLTTKTYLEADHMTHFHFTLKTEEGEREIIGLMIQNGESEETWSAFFDYLKDRGLNGTELVISDAHAGLILAIRKSFAGVSWQRCQVHFIDRKSTRLNSSHVA